MLMWCCAFVAARGLLSWLAIANSANTVRNSSHLQWLWRYADPIGKCCGNADPAMSRIDTMLLLGLFCCCFAVLSSISVCYYATYMLLSLTLNDRERYWSWSPLVRQTSPITTWIALLLLSLKRNIRLLFWCVSFFMDPGFLPIHIGILSGQPRMWVSKPMQWVPALSVCACHTVQSRCRKRCRRIDHDK